MLFSLFLKVESQDFSSQADIAIPFEENTFIFECNISYSKTGSICEVGVERKSASRYSYIMEYKERQICWKWRQY